MLHSNFSNAIKSRWLEMCSWKWIGWKPACQGIPPKISSSMQSIQSVVSLKPPMVPIQSAAFLDKSFVLSCNNDAGTQTHCKFFFLLLSHKFCCSRSIFINKNLRLKYPRSHPKQFRFLASKRDNVSQGKLINSYQLVNSKVPKNFFIPNVPANFNEPSQRICKRAVQHPCMQRRINHQWKYRILRLLLILSPTMSYRLPELLIMLLLELNNKEWFFFFKEAVCSISERKLFVLKNKNTKLQYN